MMTYRIKQGKWTLFDCYGRCPEMIEDMKKRIFNEFLPFNEECELRENILLEVYDCVNKEKSDDDYNSQILLSIKLK